MKTPEDIVNRFIKEEGVEFDQERDDWVLEAMREYAEIANNTEIIGSVSGCEYLYDKASKREVPLWYKDLDGNPLIDLDPNGINMNGRRHVQYCGKKRYEIRYR